MGQVRELRDRTMSDPDATPIEQATVFAKCAGAMKILGAMTGESLDMAETKIVKLPAFQRIVAALVKALEPYPDAMKAAASVLEGL